MDSPSRSDLFDAGAREVIARSEVRAPGKRIAPDAVYTEGTDINVLLAGASAMAEDVLRQNSKSVGALYLDSSSGDDLDRLVLDRFAREVSRRAASPALATLTLERSAGALPAVSFLAGDLIQTAGGVQFEWTAPIAIALSSNGPVSGPARAVLAGTSGNVAAGTITQLINSPDSNLRVTNAEAAAGGTDRETDASYRDRARLYFRAARRGTLGAIEYGARSAAGVVLANVAEELDSAGYASGYVYVYVADANGQANAALVQSVQDELLEWRGCGVPAIVIGAVPEYLAIQYRLRFSAGVNQAQAFAQLRYATVALVNQTPPNAPVERSLLLSLARRVPGLVVLDDTVASPLGDVYPTAGRVLRTTTDRVTLVTS